MSVNYSSLNDAHQGAFRNLVINGDFSIWQRGASAFSSNGASDTSSDGNLKFGSADRWGLSAVADVAVATMGRTDSAPDGFKYGIRLEDGYGMTQCIESNATEFPVGSRWTLSYWASRGLGSSITVDGNYATDIAVGTVNEDARDGFVRYWKTIELTHAPTNNLYVNIANATGAEGIVTGVQLEYGETVTPFCYRPKGLELDLCQRFYLKSEARVRQNFYNTGGGETVSVYAVTPQRMFKNPTLLAYGGGNNMNSNNIQTSITKDYFCVFGSSVGGIGYHGVLIDGFTYASEM